MHCFAPPKKDCHSRFWYEKVHYIVARIDDDVEGESVELLILVIVKSDLIIKYQAASFT